MKIGAAFPGNYLKAADLQGKRVRVIIERVETEEVGSEQKLVAYFKGKDRGLVLNKTNATALWGISGSDESDDWPGMEVTLFPSKTDFQGKRVDCLRIDPPDQPPAGGNPPRRQPNQKAPAPPVEEIDDEEVPF